MNKAYQLAFSILTFMSAHSYAVESTRPMDKTLNTFSHLIQGEFDNYNQVNFETNGFLSEDDIAKEEHARLYKKVIKLNAPMIGTNVFYEQTHNGGREQAIYRKSIMVVEPNYQQHTLTVKNYSLIDEIDVVSNQATLSYKQLKILGKNCETTFSLLGESFVGKIDQHQCTVPSKHGGNIHIGANFVISKSGYWHLEAGYDSKGKTIFGRQDQRYYQLSRARRFTCWTAFKTEQFKENKEPFWDFHPNISLHSQGDIAEFSTSDSQPKHYFIRLKETTFPSGKRPDVFEIFIHEKNDEAKTDYKQALAYTWANIETTRLGINLRWMQASCNLSG